MCYRSSVFIRTTTARNIAPAQEFTFGHQGRTIWFEIDLGPVDDVELADYTYACHQCVKSKWKYIISEYPLPPLPLYRCFPYRRTGFRFVVIDDCCWMLLN